MTEPGTRTSKPRRIKDRGRIFLSGALAAGLLALAIVAILSPLTATHADLHEIATEGVPLQAELVELRTTVVDWQFFIERHVDQVAPGVVADPTELIKGAGLLTRQTKQAAALSRHLSRIGFSNDARDLASAMSTFSVAVNKLAPAATGGAIEPATLHKIGRAHV